MQHLDIIVFAIVAVVIALRLRSVLGQRHDDEPRRPNPFGVPKAGKEEDDEGFMLSPKHEAALPPDALPPPAPVLAPESLAGGLTLIKQKDPSFDEKTFLHGARAAFTLIVGNFAKGDAEGLKKYLGPDVYDAFARAIQIRQAAHQRMETTIHTIKEAEVTRARLTGDVARITVRFVSEQTNLTYDEQNQIVEGALNQREEIEDIWSFARNLRQEDPHWLLVETRV
ncbi:MAG: Tim44 domain-containing protein [Alphaproteobacteria bacterium]|nr:Tim44 domain-containing protein [Alphaproteobacteria bacterium]